MYMLQEIVYSSTHLSLPTRLKMIQDVGPACQGFDLNGIRIGIPWSLKDLALIHPEKFAPFRHIINALERVCATFEHDIRIPGSEEFDAMTAKEKSILLDTDMKAAVNTCLSSLIINPQKIGSLQKLINSTKTCPSEEFPTRNVEFLERAEASRPNHELYLKMLSHDKFFTGEGGIEGALDRQQCTVLLVPTLSVTMQTFAAGAGIPVLSVPMGQYPEGTIVEKDKRSGLVDIAPGVPCIYHRAWCVNMLTYV